jgi:glycosyltransferase involved in cell wall biosynthesis
MPSVSVIIPSYNSSAFVRGAIDSVFAQTFQDYEIIVVDDGSKDSTQEVVASYKSDPRFRYHYQENRGLPGARNTGARIAQGEYFAFLDADDFLAPTALEVLQKKFAESGAAWGNVGVLKLDGDKRLVRHASMPEGDLLLAVLEDDFITRCPFFSRRGFFAVGMYDEQIKMREDWDINIRLIAQKLPYVVVDEPLYLYSRTEGSITTGNRKKLATYTEKVLHKHHKALADAGNKQIASIYAANMWGMAREYFYDIKDSKEGFRCMAESFRYDKNIFRLLHPILHRVNVALGRN